MAKDLFSSHPPTTPPTMEEDTLSVLRLIRSPRVGATTFHRMIDEHGCVAAALDALPEVARAAGVRDYAPCPRDSALRELDAARAAGATALLHGTDAYPAALAAIPDAPPLLWSIGRIDLLARPAIAMVGARNASSLGTRMARRLAEGLGHRGFVIVSGLARGIDAAAHRAALSSGTVAVMAGGVDAVYPTENLPLYDAIAETGLLLSEQPMGMAPQARHFPRRNRIISGLGHAVIVVEAAEKSGSLITARDALEQGREVLAVPGHPVDGRAAGCNRLIREGATLIRGVEDVLTAVQPANRVAGCGADDARRADPYAARTPGGQHASGPGEHRNARNGPSPDRKASAAPSRTADGSGTGAPADRGGATRETSTPAARRSVGTAPRPMQAPGAQAGPQPARTARNRPPSPTATPPRHAAATLPDAADVPEVRPPPGAQAAPATCPGPDRKPRGPSATPGAPLHATTAARSDRAPDTCATRADDAPGALRRSILSMLGPSPVAEDQIIRDLGAPTQTVLAALVALEIEGRIARLPGAMLQRT